MQERPSDIAHLRESVQNGLLSENGQRWPTTIASCCWKMAEEIFNGIGIGHQRSKPDGQNTVTHPSVRLRSSEREIRVTLNRLRKLAAGVQVARCTKNVNCILPQG